MIRRVFTALPSVPFARVRALPGGAPCSRQAPPLSSTLLLQLPSQGPFRARPVVHRFRDADFRLGHRIAAFHDAKPLVDIEVAVIVTNGEHHAIPLAPTVRT